MAIGGILFGWFRHIAQDPTHPIGVSEAHIPAKAKNQAVPLRGRAKHELNPSGRSMWSTCISQNRQRPKKRRKGRHWATGMKKLTNESSGFASSIPALDSHTPKKSPLHHHEPSPLAPSAPRLLGNCEAPLSVVCEDAGRAPQITAPGAFAFEGTEKLAQLTSKWSASFQGPFLAEGTQELKRAKGQSDSPQLIAVNAKICMKG